MRLNFDDYEFEECRRTVSAAICNTMKKMIKHDVFEGGSVAMKINIKLYPGINDMGEREIIPVVDYNVTSQVPVKNAKSGIVEFTGCQVVYDEYQNDIKLKRGVGGQVGMEFEEEDE